MRDSVSEAEAYNDVLAISQRKSEEASSGEVSVASGGISTGHIDRLASIKVEEAAGRKSYSL